MMDCRKAGFTLVEVVVTMVVASLLLIAAMQIQYQATNLSIIQLQQSRASNLAYDNMRKYVNDSRPMWFNCPDSKGRPGVGQQVLKDTTGTVDGLPGAVTQRVVATAPYGCGVSSGLGLPIKVESIVIYRGGSSTHAAYAAY